MTKEMEMKLALDAYDEEMENIRKEYDRRFKKLLESGEALAEGVLELNAWSIQKKEEAKRVFVKEWTLISAK